MTSLASSIGAILLGAVVSQAVPHDVVHTRCLRLVEQADFDKFEWVTRDGARGADVFGCHPMWMVEDRLMGEQHSS